MCTQKQLTLCLYFSIFAFSAQYFCAWAQGDFDNKYYIILNPESGLVLDAAIPEIKIQNSTGGFSQTWQLESGGEVGTYYIISSYTGGALDYYYSDAFGFYVVQSRFDQSLLQQQWFLNSDGRIVNAAVPYFLDFQYVDYFPGENLILTYESNSTNQVFRFVEVF